MCEFCEENKSINNEFGYMHIDDDLESSVAIYGEPYINDGYFKINHCPMCGRKLGED